MGTISTRRRKDGTLAHTAQIRIKEGGRVVHSEAQTFERRPAAAQWLKTREAELAEPGALGIARRSDPTLGEAIRHYITNSSRALGRTKAQVLSTIADDEQLAGLRCSQVRSQQIVEFANRLTGQPQTRGNYISHLAAVFDVAQPAWGFPLDAREMQSARIVLKRLGVVGKSRSRERRPKMAELEQLLEHFSVQQVKRRGTLPMVELVLFALFSTRRQEEVTRLTWDDLDAEHAQVTVRDMKHPGEKIGNDVRVTLPEPAMAVAIRQPKGDARIFPFNAESVSTAFTRACKLLGIKDLHFHDLRHEGISRLFEMGQTIPQVAAVSGHRSWASLKRYTHLRSVGDKYEGWKWTPQMPKTQKENQH